MASLGSKLIHHLLNGMKITRVSSPAINQKIGLSRLLMNSSPQRPRTNTSKPNLIPRPNSPATMKSLTFILPVPAAHATALYGMGETAAMNTPASPNFSVKASIFDTDDGLASLRKSGRPPNRPIAYPPSDPMTLENVATRKIKKSSNGLSVARDIGMTNRSGGTGWKAASVEEIKANPSSPKLSAQLMTNSLIRASTFNRQ